MWVDTAKRYTLVGSSRMFTICDERAVAQRVVDRVRRGGGRLTGKPPPTRSGDVANGVAWYA